MGLIPGAKKRGKMRTFTKCIAAALILGMSVGVANAAISVGFDLGNVAIGYSDGYYDNAHHWHAWRRHDDMMAYRNAHADNYHEWRHNDKHHH
jgi:hypothetical protein